MRIDEVRGKIRALKYLYQTGNIGTIIPYMRGKRFKIETTGGAKIECQRGEGMIGKLSKEYRKGHRILDLNDDFFVWVDEKNILLKKKEFPTMYCWVDEYCRDVRPDQNILDVGGYMGATAVWFKSYAEADQVFVYEPIEENCRVIRKNKILNDFEESIEIINKGAGENSGEKTVKSEVPAGSISFGSHGEQDIHIKEIQVKSWEKILEKASKDNVTVAHLNCEGAEKHLKSVEDSLLREVEEWYIACHGEDIFKSLKEKFEEAGFEVDFLEDNNPKIRCTNV